MGSGNQRQQQTWKRTLTWGLLGAGLSLTVPLTHAPLTHANKLEVWHHLPDNTPLVMFFDTTADSWGQLSQFQLFKLLETDQGLTPTLPGLPYLPYGLDFAADVAPWVGDTAVVALLPAAPGTFAAMADHVVMVAPVNDTEALDRFRSTVFDLQGDAEEVITTLGTDIYLWPAPDYGSWENWEPEWDEDWEPDWDADDEPWIDCEVEPEVCYGDLQSQGGWRRRPTRQALRFGGGLGLPLTVHAFHEDNEEFELNIPMPVPGVGPGGLAIAFLPDTVIAAETPGAIEQYLTLRQQTVTSLAESSEFRRTLTNVEQSRALLAVYGNALELLNFDPTLGLPEVGLPLPLPPTPSFDPEAIQKLRAFNFGGTLEGLIYPSTTGIQAQGRYYYDLAPFTFGLTAAAPEADSLLDLLPASTFLMMSGRNVAGFWRGLSHFLESASEFTSEGLATARSFFTLATGLDLDRDLFGWMDGEVAFAAFPTKGGPLQYLGLGLLLQTSDRPTAENTLAVVDDLLPGFGLTSQPRLVNNQPATSWEFFSSGNDSNYIPDRSFGSHSWLTDNTLALTSGTVPMGRLLAPSPHDPLAGFFLFRQATATFPRPNDGYFYLNVGATLSLAYEVFEIHNDPLFDSLKPYLGSVRSLSATSTQTPRYLELQGQMGLARRRD